MTTAETLPDCVRLTTLAHGGGCGCKLAPSVLQTLLAGSVDTTPFPQLLVGAAQSDDAAVWRQDDGRCIIATTDFFMPMVDDPYDFGRIAATNAISDIYAMGGHPIFALAVLGMPIDKLPASVIRDILRGGASICAEAGIPVAGGHSIDAPEPIYGLAVIGTAAADNIKRNAGALAGDALILTKPLGVGIYSSAIKKGRLTAPDYAEFLATTTKLNRVGTALGMNRDVHAMTDVTGFGILGHGLEMARASALTLQLDVAALPLLTHAARYAQEGCVTGASHRNWQSYGKEVDGATRLPEWKRHLLTDPQTSGGLLIACSADRAGAIMQHIRDVGFDSACRIGTVMAGPPRLSVA